MNNVKNLFTAICIFMIPAGCMRNNPAGSPEDRVSFDKTKTAIQEGFAKGDVDAVLALHHPDVVKYFGEKNIVTGREGLRKQLADMFSYARTEFIENDIESTIFNGDAVVETCIFGMRMIPKNGDSSRIFRGRSMVVYVRYKDSPTGWASIREMVQEAPVK
jgi:ketosteroid isomerase-like protein